MFGCNFCTLLSHGHSISPLFVTLFLLVVRKATQKQAKEATHKQC